MKNYIIPFLFLITSLLGDQNAPLEDSYSFEGSHFLASYMDCDHEALTNIDKLRQTMLDAAALSGATVLKSEDYTFPPDGFTMVVLLSESHASIHTYPEHRACFIDLFTCGNTCSSVNFASEIKAYLNPKKIIEKKIFRGETLENTLAE